MAGRATLTMEPSIVATADPTMAASRIRRWRRVTECSLDP
jgi:hypothetical protein